MSEELIPRLGLRELKIQQNVDSYRLGINEADLKSVEAYGRDFVNEVMPTFERKMCATCADCKHKQGQSEAYMEHRTDQLIARAVVGCSKARQRSDGDLELRTGDPYCPDGFNLRSRLWVDPQTFASTWIEQSAPLSEELQNHLTKPDLEAETRKRVFDILAGHDPSRGMVTQQSCREHLTQEKQHRKEEFFGPGGEFVSTRATALSAEWPADTAGKFRDEYQMNPLTNDPEFITTSTLSQKAAILRDIPQGPDVGTW